MAEKYPRQAQELTKADLKICTLCNYQLQDPKLLPCYHSFCCACLKKKYTISLKLEEGHCPTCSQTFSTRGGNIDALPNNYLLPLLVGDKAGAVHKLVCLVCEFKGQKTQATYKCLDCGDPLCTQCQGSHSFSSVTRHHKVLPLQDFQSEKWKQYMKEQKLVPCFKHSTPREEANCKYLCQSCEILVCQDCVIMEHKGHMCMKIGTIDKKKYIPNTHLSTLKEILQKNFEFCELLENNTASYQSETESFVSDIHKNATELHELVDKIKLEKLHNLKTHMTNETMKLHTEITRYKNANFQIQTAIAFTELFAANSSETEFFQHQKDIKVMLQELSTKKGAYKVNINPVELVKSTNTVPATTSTLSNHLGSIKTTSKCMMLPSYSYTTPPSDVDTCTVLHFGEVNLVSTIHKPGVKSVAYSKSRKLVAISKSKVEILDDKVDFVKQIPRGNEVTFAALVNNQRQELFLIVQHLKGLLTVYVVHDELIPIKTIKLDGQTGWPGRYNIDIKSIAVDNDQNLYFVLSFMFQTIYKSPFDTEGVFELINLSRKGEEIPEVDISVTSSQYLAILLGSQLKMYTLEGQFVWSCSVENQARSLQYESLFEKLQLSQNNRSKRDKKGDISHSKKICCDSNGYIYILEKDKHLNVNVNAFRIHVLDGNSQSIATLPFRFDFQFGHCLSFAVSFTGNIVLTDGETICRLQIQ